MGIEEGGPDFETEGTDLKAPEIIEQDTLQNTKLTHQIRKECQECNSTCTELKSREKSTSDDSGLEDSDWTRFKMEFSAKLQNVENKINSEPSPGDHVILAQNHVTSTTSNLRQQLLINAITSLHSSRQGQQREESIEPMPSVKTSATCESDRSSHTLEAGDDTGNTIVDGERELGIGLEIADNREGEGVSAPKGVLSLEAFDGIHEISLDHVLNNIDVARSPTSGTSCSSDDSGLELNGKGPPPPPHPKLAWTVPRDVGGDGETLMEELEQLSLAQGSTQVTGAASFKHVAGGVFKGL